MGIAIATLLFAVLNTTWVIATFLWGLRGKSRWLMQQNAASRNQVSSTIAARGEFPASRGVLFLTWPEMAGGDEVKQ